MTRQVRLIRVSALVTLLTLVLAACGAPNDGATASTAPAASPSAAASTVAESPATSTAASTGASTAAESPAAASGAAQTGATDQGACTAEAASTAPPSGKTRLVIGTGGTGGVFFPYGGGLARILTAKLPNAEATAEVTGGSVDNLKLLQAGDADIGMTTEDSAFDALRGEGVYKDSGAVPACTLAVLYRSFIHVVALDGSGINTVTDMKGKRISVGSAGSSTEVAADRILEAAGLNPRADITRDNLSVAESVGAMKDQKIDAFFWIGGLPTAAVTDLVTTPNLKVKFIPTDQYLKPLSDKYGAVYTNYALPAGVYTGVEGETPGIGIANILVVNANMPEQLAYDILKTFFDNLTEVQAIHPEAKKFTLESAAATSALPFHPGALRFYKEKGVMK